MNITSDLVVSAVEKAKIKRKTTKGTGFNPNLFTTRRDQRLSKTIRSPCPRTISTTGIKPGYYSATKNTTAKPTSRSFWIYWYLFPGFSIFINCI